MDHYDLGVALAVAHLAELRRHADRHRLASRDAARRRDRAPGSPRLRSRHGQAADCARGGCAAAAVAGSGPGRATKEEPC